MTIQKNSMFDVPLHRSRENGTFDITTDTRTGFHAHRMIHTRDVLLDDRALIEISGDVVSGRADQLHAPIVRLAVRLRSLKARQERMVDIDRPSSELLAHIRRQDLHIAG